MFDQSLDEARTLESVARLCVRDLADTCVLVLGDTPRSVRRVVTAAREPDRERALLELQLRYPLEDDPSHPVLEAMLTGRTRVVEQLPPERFAEVAEDDRELELLHALRIGAAVIVPLRARGAVCGAMALGFGSLADEDVDFVLAMLEDLGRRAALALDTARLYEERDSIARTLQRSLLPPALPAIAGHRRRRALPRRGPRQRGRRRLLRLLRDRPGRVGGGDRRRLRQGRRGGRGDRARPLHDPHLGAARPAARRGAARAQRGDPQPARGLPLLHRGARRAHARRGRRRRRLHRRRRPPAAAAGAGRRARRARRAPGHAARRARRPRASTRRASTSTRATRSCSTPTA